MNKKIAIIDYGIGNVGSVANMLKKIGCQDVVLAKTSENLQMADAFILPGVGAFDAGMMALNDSGMRNELDRQVLDKRKPILGICLGMQMLGKRSEEGRAEGLGYISFECKRLDNYNNSLRVPHMGWDYVSVKKNLPITMNIPDELRFYFVHSYYAECEQEDNVLMTCDYGREFAVAVCKDNIYGTQFHPEKSHNFGKWFLKNFIAGV